MNELNNLLSKVGLSTAIIINIIIGIAIIIWVFLVAKIVANIIWKLVSKAGFINKAFRLVDVELNMKKIWSITSKITYYILILIGIVAGLAYAWFVEKSAVNWLINDYLMNFINAGILAIVAWFLAVIARSFVTKWAKSIELDKKLNVEKAEVPLSETAWTIAYWAVILFFISPILEKLGQEELVAPIKKIIDNILGFIPNLLAALLIFAISYFIAKIIKEIITNILTWIWFDKILSNIWLKNVEAKTSPSKVVWTIVFSYIVLLAWIEAANSLGLNGIAQIINNIIIFATNVLLWIVILGIWIYIANLVADMIKSTSNSKILPIIAKTAIIVVVWFMGLKQMNIGWAIIDQAFSLILGSIAVAFALAVGLGSKEVAGEEVKKLIEKMKK